MAIATRTIEANGFRFAVDEAGKGDRLALCLHGFPESRFSWRYQLPLLAQMGYRAWAPDLPWLVAARAAIGFSYGAGGVVTARIEDMGVGLDLVLRGLQVHAHHLRHTATCGRSRCCRWCGGRWSRCCKATPEAMC